jgi:hypothetical protein
MVESENDGCLGWVTENGETSGIEQRSEAARRDSEHPFFSIREKHMSQRRIRQGMLAPRRRAAERCPVGGLRRHATAA